MDGRKLETVFATLSPSTDSNWWTCDMAKKSSKTVQLSLMSPGGNGQAATTLEAPNESDCGEQQQVMMARHPYNEALGDRTPKGVEHLTETLRASHHVIEVKILEGQVLSDWDKYRIAVQENLPINVLEYDGVDPLAFACADVLHGLGITKREKAMRIVSAFPWAERGRPKKCVSDTGFRADEIKPLTATEMAALAECSQETVRQARRIASYGLAESVIHGDLTFTDALRSIKGTRDTRGPDAKGCEQVTSLEKQSVKFDAEVGDESGADHLGMGVSLKNPDAQQADELAL